MAEGLWVWMQRLRCPFASVAPEEAGGRGRLVPGGSSHSPGSAGSWMCHAGRSSQADAGVTGQTQPAGSALCREAQFHIQAFVLP